MPGKWSHNRPKDRLSLVVNESNSHPILPVVPDPEDAARREKRRSKAIKNAGRYILYGEELTRKAVIHRVIEGEPFEKDVVAKIEKWAEKKELGDVLAPTSAAAERLQGFGELALQLHQTLIIDGPEPSVPRVIELNKDA